MRSLLLIGFASSVWAQVYTWTDKQGVTHFTDNRDSVPANVKARITEGDEISTLVLAETKKAEVAAPTKTIPEDPEKAELAWRSAFREVRERIARLEDEIEIDRHKVEDVNGLPVAARYQCFYGGWGTWVPGASQVSGAGVSFTGAGQIGPGVAVGGTVFARQNVVITPFAATATAPCIFTFNPEHERAKERLALNRKALERAKDELADLERKASFEGVPLHWRR